MRASCVSLGAPCGFSCPLFVCRAGCAARPVRSRFRLRECVAVLPCWCCFSGLPRCPLACLALALPPLLPLGAGCAARCRRRRVPGLSCPALLLSENYFAVRLPPGPRPGVASPPRVPRIASSFSRPSVSTCPVDGRCGRAARCFRVGLRLVPVVPSCPDGSVRCVRCLCRGVCPFAPLGAASFSCLALSAAPVCLWKILFLILKSPRPPSVFFGRSTCCCSRVCAAGVLAARSRSARALRAPFLILLFLLCLATVRALALLLWPVRLVSSGKKSVAVVLVRGRLCVVLFEISAPARLSPSKKVFRRPCACRPFPCRAAGSTEGILLAGLRNFGILRA